MPTIKVFPTHESAMSIKHPTSGSISDDGSFWEHDAFTSRMIADGAITSDDKFGFKSERPKPDHSKPPARATGSGVVADVAAVVSVDSSADVAVDPTSSKRR